jgi:hypothetical protein
MNPNAANPSCALDFAVAVGTTYLRRFTVPRPRRFLFYAAEGALHLVPHRA